MDSRTHLHRRVPALGKLRTPYKYTFTKDPHLLNAYYKIRAECYRSVENGPGDFSYEADKLDTISDILVVSLHGRIVGGARLAGSKESYRITLPVETGNFRMANVLPHLQLENKNICEFGRIAIAPEHRSFSVLESLCEKLIRRAIRQGYHYQFSMAPKAQARCYRRVGSKLKLPYPYIIHENIDVPCKPQEETGNLKMYLGSLQLPASLPQNASDREAA